MPTLPGVVGAGGSVQGGIAIQGFPMPEAGRYVFELVIDGEPVSRYTVNVIDQTRERGHGSTPLLH